MPYAKTDQNMDGNRSRRQYAEIRMQFIIFAEVWHMTD